MPGIDSMNPRTGRIMKEDGSVVNEAEGLNFDGSRNIRASARKAIVITAGSDIEPTMGVVVAEDTDATVIFSGDTEAVSVKLLAGVVYPYSVKKVVNGDGIVGLYP